MSIEMVPSGAALGAEFRGVNLSQSLDGETFAAIENAYNMHGVIFFRDQSLRPAQQVAFTRRFGEIEFNVLSAGACRAIRKSAVRVWNASANIRRAASATLSSCLPIAAECWSIQKCAADVTETA